MAEEKLLTRWEAAERLFILGGAFSDGVRLQFHKPSDADDVATLESRVGGRLVGLLAPIGLSGTKLALFQQVPIGAYRADFYIPQARLVVEVDGHDFHSSKAQLAADKGRDRSLVKDGYQVIRFTGSEIYADPGRCIHSAWEIGSSLALAREAAKSSATQAAEASS